MIYKFFDTSALLSINKKDFLQNDYRIVISTITLQEVEKKGSRARKILKWLNKYSDRYDVYVFKREMMNDIVAKNLDISNDSKILATAIAYDREVHPDETVFVTNKQSLKHIANLFFGNDSIEIFKKENF